MDSRLGDAARDAYERGRGERAERVQVAVPEKLSARELQVLQRIAQGDTNRQIAQLFDRSEETVKAHVRRVLEKLGVSSRAHAVAVGFREGLLT